MFTPARGDGMRKISARTGRTVMIAAAIGVIVAADARAQCNLTPLTAGLRSPLGVTESNQGNLLVTEQGIATVPHSGRVSIVDLDGSRRTLIDGLPSARSDEGGVSGPSGLFMRGRTLYVSIGIGDTLQPPAPGSTARIGNPNPSSRLFSSVLAIHFSAHIEQTTGGVFLTLADQDDLADGRKVTLTDGSGGAVAIEMVANVPGQRARIESVRTDDDGRSALRFGRRQESGVANRRRFRRVRSARDVCSDRESVVARCRWPRSGSGTRGDQGIERTPLRHALSRLSVRRRHVGCRRNRSANGRPRARDLWLGDDRRRAALLRRWAAGGLFR